MDCANLTLEYPVRPNIVVVWDWKAGIVDCSEPILGCRPKKSILNPIHTLIVVIWDLGIDHGNFGLFILSLHMNIY